MKENHILDILENSTFASLSESDHQKIRAHTASCAECARAYKVAIVAGSLLKDRVSEVFEPSPFFSTRVLAAIRERQNEAPAFQRLWRAAGAMVSSMTATVALLAVLSFLVPGTQPLTAEASTLTGYSAEEVILNESGGPPEQASDAQMLSSLYDADEDER
jgi:anti-sigma factor RsiW